MFVFDNITASKPTLLFKVVHLYHGEAMISGYNTLLTGEVDLNSAINTGRGDAQMTIDLFREFKWSDGAGTFTPNSFSQRYSGQQWQDHLHRDGPV